MALPDELLQSFVRDGFLHIEKVVGERKVAAANKLLNHLLGRCGELQGGGLQGEGWGKIGGGHAHAPAVRELYFGEVQRVVSELIFADDANLSGQIALRFPEYQTSAAEEEETPMWHTDGLRQGKYHPFSLLVGVCLSDVSEERGSGNLLVYPGSHHVVSRAITGEHGAIDVGLLRGLLGGESDAAAPPTPPAFHDNEPELPIPGTVKGFAVKAGDLLLLHPDLPHCGDRNLSSEVRKMVYFRIKSRTKGPTTWEDASAAHRKFPWADFAPRVQRIAAEFCGMSSHHHHHQSTPRPPSSSSSSFSSISSSEAVVQLKDKQLMSRLLYSNPVCLLSTFLPAEAGAPAAVSNANVMVCSWLTCIDNRGGVFLSINEKRTSALAFSQPWRAGGSDEEWAPVTFVLSVPTSDLEAVILRVGSCHGSSVDKFGTIAGLSPCAPGWAQGEAREGEQEADTRPPAVAECVAHIVLVASSRPMVNSGHLHVFAEMKQAWVKAAYWDGKCFAPKKVGVAPLVAFNGTKCFSAMTPLFQPSKGGL